MQTNKLKTYAPKARRDFIAAVTRRAAKFGLTAKGVSPNREQGQLVFIEGQPYPKSVGAQRVKLAERIAQQGFQQVMEAAAYTWFNRFAAIRFMELHGYLDHSFRVLSHPTGGALPEILEQAQHVDLPGLDRQRVIELKMDGTRDEALYRDLLLAQCRALHNVMPFLFERVDDETELLLPDNLLQTDSLIRELVTAIPEEDWQEIEIIGWLYQFYIADKKKDVIGKVVKSEDIPAATQLFTPNWIVKYMVQNSLGAQWLATYPDSPLKGQMEYYIEPAEQTEEVKAQLAAITPSTLNPEELTLIDPACGSGHILVEAYELFKAIYLERGYRQRDVAKLILEKNLFGLDIDGRSAQLTGFALMMKGRADDRRLFERGVKLNVMALVDSTGFDAERLAQGVKLSDYGLHAGDLTELKQLFEHATTFGSLIRVPERLEAKLLAMKHLSEATSQDLFVSEALKRLGPLEQQAKLLTAQYDAVAANPPYMGSKYYCQRLSQFIDDHYSAAKPDIYACFIQAGLDLCRASGRIANITIPGWMMNSTFADFRSDLLERGAIISLVHNGRGVFGSDFGSCVFTILNYSIGGLNGRYRCLFEKASAVSANEVLAVRFKSANDYVVSPLEFRSVEAAPLSYQISSCVRKAYERMPAISGTAIACQGLSTSSDPEFVRLWHEVSAQRSSWIGLDNDYPSKLKWFPYNKGGDYRKWYGNIGFVLNWENEGEKIKKRRPKSVIRNERFYFQESISWQDYTIGACSFRLYPEGFIFATNAHSAFAHDSEAILKILGFCNSVVLSVVAEAVSPGLHFNSGYFALVPFSTEYIPDDGRAIPNQAVQIATIDWNAYERSWDFHSLPILTGCSEPTSNLESSYTAWTTQNRGIIAEMTRLEEENNRLFIDAYGLQDELTPDVPIEQITLTVNPAYRYGWKGVRDEGRGASEDGASSTPHPSPLDPDPYEIPELAKHFREDTMQELVSYAIGCAMGRYRLDRPGLIYAHAGNERFWEIYEEGVRGEGLGASEEGMTDEHQELSRLDRLAEGDGSGGAGLSGNAAVSQGGVLRPYQPDQTSCSIDPIKHRGGAREAVESRVSELSVDRSGIPGRSGNTDPDRATIGLLESGCRDGNPRTSRRNLAHAQHACDQASLTPSPSPLTPNPFPPDADGIIPITDADWFDDDATHRIVEFISMAWDKAHLEENLKFLADNLSPKKSESSRDTIRRCLSDRFFKDHLQTYKKRPIYWCFSSGKQKAFQCLVYLHRYHESTLARMRMEYVVPLQSKMAARIDTLADDIQAASTSAQAERLRKERDKLTKQLDELRRFDEQLRHYADQRIALDLDDGVKVNYGKFGNLLAEVKAVTGKGAD